MRNGRSFARRSAIERAVLVLLLSSVAAPAHAGSSTAAGSDATQPATSDPRAQPIIVTAPRLFPDVQPERELDEQAIAGYGVSTVDELLGEVAVELGDDAEEPLIIVNGQRVSSLDDIGAFPVEALRNIQVLPRGTAVRLGGTSGQRVISITLKPRTRTATLTVAPKISTEGDWRAGRGEGIFTYVRGATRANVALRVRGETKLFESDRGIVQPEPLTPFALGGNVVGFPNTAGEIDSLLSSAAGELVTVAGVPASANPGLSDFVATANDPNTTDLGQFRTLRPRLRNYDLSGTLGARLLPWLTGSATVHLARNDSVSQRGLPSGLFILPATNPASPFSTDVGLVYYGTEPLRYRSRRDSGDANLTLDGQFGKWTGNFIARHSESKDVSDSDRQSSFGAIALGDTINPFATDLTDLIGIRTDRATARSNLSLAQLSFTGPAANLPAGPIEATIEGRLSWNRLRTESTFSISGGNASFHRSEQSIRGAVEVPLTSRDANFLPEIGELTATAEYSRVHFSDAGTLNNHSFGLTWEPRPPLRLRASIEQTERPAAIQTLGNPVIVSPLVRIFDPLTGETVDVVQISGGNPDLDPEELTVRRLTAILRPLPRLQLSAEYTDTDARHFVSSLPEASAAVMLAFPERLIRDPGGTLTTIDLRPVNFDSHREKRFRYGLSLNTMLGGGAAPKLRRRGPATRLQLTANHSMVFSDRILIRPGLDSVDLLEGGAIGIASGRVRHQLDGTAALTSGGLGARLGVTWRGPSTLESRIGTTTDTLRFSPLLLVNLRAFTDFRRLLPHSDWATGLRLSVQVTNLFNDRQEVRDSAGATPLRYQPGYRDPLGRTIELEFRKVF